MGGSIIDVDGDDRHEGPRYHSLEDPADQQHPGVGYLEDALGGQGDGAQEEYGLSAWASLYLLVKQTLMQGVRAAPKMPPVRDMPMMTPHTEVWAATSP